MLSSLASALSLCTVGKRVDGGGGGQGQRARRSSSAQDAGMAAVAVRSTAVLLHSDGGSRGLRPRQPLPAAADASARPRLLAGCATARDGVAAPAGRGGHSSLSYLDGRGTR